MSFTPSKIFETTGRVPGLVIEVWKYIKTAGQTTGTITREKGRKIRRVVSKSDSGATAALTSLTTVGLTGLDGVTGSAMDTYGTLVTAGEAITAAIEAERTAGETQTAAIETATTGSKIAIPAALITALGSIRTNINAAIIAAPSASLTAAEANLTTIEGLLTTNKVAIPSALATAIAALRTNQNNFSASRTLLRTNQNSLATNHTTVAAETIVGVVAIEVERV